MNQVFTIVLMVTAAGGTAGFASMGPAIATVGDRTIFDADVGSAVQQKINASYYHRRVPDDTIRQLRCEALHELIERKLDTLGALERQLETPLELAERQRAAVESQLGDQYSATIAARGWSIDDHREVISETLLGNEARRRFIIEPSKVNGAEIAAEYQADPDRWKMPESARVFNILLEVPQGASSLQWSEREKEAKALLDLLRNGASFQDLASEHSDDMFSIRGGDLGWIHRGRLEASLETVVWSAGIGSPVGPARSSDGVHLLLVSERRPAHQLSLEEAEPALKVELENERAEELGSSWYSEIEIRHPVKILDPDLKTAWPGNCAD